MACALGAWVEGMQGELYTSIQGAASFSPLCKRSAATIGEPIEKALRIHAILSKSFGRARTPIKVTWF